MPSPTGVLHIRNMSRKEVDLAIEWAAQEGWNPGLHDAEPFYRADPNGFFVGEKDGEIVATVSQVSYPESDLCFGGFFIVRPDVRAQGIGGEMLRFFLQRGKDRNIGIDGVANMVPTYEKSGFHFAYWNHRFKGIGGGQEAKMLCPTSELPFEEVLIYDREIFSASREAFLRSFLNQPATTSLAFVRGGKFCGYGALRPCRVGYKVAPLFADSPAIADMIIRGLISAIPGEPYFIDIPAPNKEAMHLAKEFQMSEVFRTARLYTKRTPAIPLHKIFGITSFELG